MGKNDLAWCQKIEKFFVSKEKSLIISATNLISNVVYLHKRVGEIEPWYNIR